MMWSRLLPGTWWLRLILVLTTYVLAADVLPNVVLVLIDCAGYLPYGDRPGPGWQTPHLPSNEEVRFFLGFAQLLLKPTALYGGIFLVADLVLGLSGLPRWGVRAIATPVAFLTSGLMMAAAGWIIAISSLGVIVAAFSGGLWGLLLFPLLVFPIPSRLPPSARIAIPMLSLGGGIYLIIRPILPDPALTNAKIEIVRRNEAGELISNFDFSYLGSSRFRSVMAPGTYVATNRLDFSTDDRNQVRVLLIVEDAEPVAHIFDIPRTGEVVFGQSHGTWVKERGGDKESKIYLELRLGRDNEIDLEIKGPCCSSMSQASGPFR